MKFLKGILVAFLCVTVFLSTSAPAFADCNSFFSNFDTVVEAAAHTASTEDGIANQRDKFRSVIMTFAEIAQAQLPLNFFIVTLYYASIATHPNPPVGDYSSHNVNDTNYIATIYQCNNLDTLNALEEKEPVEEFSTSIDGLSIDES